MKFVGNQSLPAWLLEYKLSHQHAINKKLHWLCVPTIAFCLVGFGVSFSAIFTLLLIGLVLFFYASLSIPLMLLMTVFFGILYVAALALPISLKGFLALFVLAWIGQFIGHAYEGQKPSFFKDLQFLLIGPAWVAESVASRISPKLSFLR